MKGKWILLLLLPVVLTGCAGRQAAGSGKSAEEPAVQTEEPVTVEASSPRLAAAQTENQARPLTREEVMAAYDRAVRACGWFERTTLPCGGDSVTVDGRRYYRVEYPGFQDLDDLRAYLRELFAPAVTERLLASGGDEPVYIELDGALYAAPISRGRDPGKGAVETEAVQNGDTAYSVNVTVELLDADRVTVTGIECCSFPYELVDGRWVFTAFYLVD